MAGKQVTKSKYFIELHEKLKANDDSDFWELSIARDSMTARTASYVVFRHIGVDVPRYIMDRREQWAEIRGFNRVHMEPDDEAVLEFLYHYNVDKGMGSMQAEALTFRGLLKDRDFQLWLAESLSKIPHSQWEKAQTKFKTIYGNPLFAAVYSVWDAVARGKDYKAVIAKFMSEFNLLERFLLVEAFDDCELDDADKKRVDKISEHAIEHGKEVTRLLHRSSRLSYANVEYQGSNITSAGATYYGAAAVLWSLWKVSLEDDKEANEYTLTGGLNCLSTKRLAFMDMLAVSYYNEWVGRFDSEKQDDTVADSKEVAKLRNELTKTKDALQETRKRAKSAEKNSENFKNKAEAMERRANEYLTRAENAEKELQEAKDEIAELELIALADGKGIGSENEQEIPQDISELTNEDRLDLLETQVTKLTSELLSVTNEVADLYALLGSENGGDEAEYDYNETVDDRWDEQIEGITGRVLLFGGSSTWRERVSKHFEERDIKCRCYEAREGIVGMRKSDLLFLNVIENKHKYSVKVLGDARKLGVKVCIAGVNNTEQTLKTIFTRGFNIAG